MLAILRSRLGNPADEELRIAAAEQARITELRLKKLIDS
jgi:2-oxo-4-hydroxy-4-carboxy-5-ureidoimidazoline decarboxylase